MLLQTPRQLPVLLKALRRRRGLTQAQVAQRLGVKQARHAIIEAHPETVSTGQLLPDGVITSPLVRHYFDNLLPDDPRIRERLRIRFATRSADTFDVLEALGRDCIGAVRSTGTRRTSRSFITPEGTTD